MSRIRKSLARSLVSLVLAGEILVLSNPSLSNFERKTTLPFKTVYLPDSSLVYERERLTVLTKDNAVIFYNYDPKSETYVFNYSEDLTGEKRKIPARKYYPLP